VAACIKEAAAARPSGGGRQRECSAEQSAGGIRLDSVTLMRHCPSTDHTRAWLRWPLPAAAAGAAAAAAAAAALPVSASPCTAGPGHQQADA
jgi:hypothetical protein